MSPSHYQIVASAVLGLTLQCSTAAAVEANFELNAEYNMAYGSEVNRMDQAELNLQPKLELQLNAQTELTLSTRLRWNNTEHIVGERRALETYTQGSRPWQQGDFSIELRDAYVERSLGNAHLRIGKQQIVWGALDGLKLLDAVNPQDFREFILDDFDESRISQWAVQVEVPLAGGYLELALVPDTSVHELPAADAKFAFTAERFRFGLPAASVSNSTLEQRTRRSNDAVKDGTYALRYSRFTGGWDLAASVVTGPDHTPVAELLPGPSGDRVLERQYRDRTIVGFSAEKSYGSIALRTELAARPDRAFNRSTADSRVIEVIERDQYSAALAMDWQAPADFFINLQLLHERIHNHDRALATPKADTLATALIRRNFRYDTLTTELRWYGNLNDDDGLIRPSIAWQIGDNTRLRLGADLFYGNRNGLFGQFADADQYTLTLQQVF
ncbi:MAG: DUF1302 family protein [Pseudomonadales bacterium]